MTREELKQRATELLGFATADNHARISEILTEITESFDTITTTSEQNENRVKELTENNEKLREVNANLFLKVGTQTPAKTPEETPEETDEAEIISFDSLFNEKGDLI